MSTSKKCVHYSLVDLQLLEKTKAKKKALKKPKPFIDPIAVGFEFSLRFYDDLIKLIDTHIDNASLKEKFTKSLTHLKECKVKTRTGMKFYGIDRPGCPVSWDSKDRITTHQRFINSFWKSLDTTAIAEISQMWYTLNAKVLAVQVTIKSTKYISIVLNDERSGRGGRATTIRTDIKRGNFASHGGICQVAIDDYPVEVTFYRFRKETFFTPQKKNLSRMNRKVILINEYRNGTEERVSTAPSSYFW